MTPQEQIMALDERLDAVEQREIERHAGFRRAAAFVRKLRSRAINAAYIGDAAVEIELLTVAVDVLSRGEG